METVRIFNQKYAIKLLTAMDFRGKVLLVCILHKYLPTDTFCTDMTESLKNTRKFLNTELIKRVSLFLKRDRHNGNLNSLYYWHL